MGIDKAAFFQSKLLALLIHFIYEGLYVVFMPFIRKFECLVDHVVHITLFIGKGIDFSFHSEDRYF